MRGIGLENVCSSAVSVLVGERSRCVIFRKESTQGPVAKNEAIGLCHEIRATIRKESAERVQEN